MNKTNINNDDNEKDNMELVLKHFLNIQRFEHTLFNMKTHEDEKKVIQIYCLYEMAKKLGYKISDDILSAEQWKPFVFSNIEDTNHQCHYTTCQQFNIKKGLRVVNPFNQTTFISSGNIFICNNSGKIHICTGEEACNFTIIDESGSRYKTNLTGSFICIVTCMYKGNPTSNIPKFDEKYPPKFNVDRIKNYEEDKNRQLGLLGTSANTFSSNYYERFHLNESQKKELSEVSLPSFLKEAKLLDLSHCETLPDVIQSLGLSYDNMDKEMLHSVASLISSSELKNEFFEKVIQKKLIKESSLQTSNMSFYSHVPPEYYPKTKRNTSTKIVQKRKSYKKENKRRVAPYMPTPERTYNRFMLNINDKYRQAENICRRLTSFKLRRILYNHYMKECSEFANKKLNSVKRKANHKSNRKELTTIDCISMFLGFCYAKKLDDSLIRYNEKIDYNMFASQMIKIWEILTKTPYAVNQRGMIDSTGVVSTKKKKLLLGFQKLVLAILRKASCGGAIYNCSIDMSNIIKFKIDEIQDSLVCEGKVGIKLSHFRMRIIPGSEKLQRNMFSPKNIDDMNKNFNLTLNCDTKTISQGLKVLSKCMASSIKYDQKNMFDKLKQIDPTDNNTKLKIVQEYVNNCIFKKISFGEE